MSPIIKIALNIIWGCLLFYWLYASMNTGKTSYKEPLFKRFAFYWLPLIFAVYLLGPGEWFGHTLIRENFVPHSNLVGVIGLIFCFAGAVLACWSRYLLGRNWSVSVEKKENHELIIIGPYKLIRHPIYTGLLFLFSGNALIVGDYRGLIAVAIVFIAFWLKLRKEEKWLAEIFGEQYLAYIRRTKALFPWLI